MEIVYAVAAVEPVSKMAGAMGGAEFNAVGQAELMNGKRYRNRTSKRRAGDGSGKSEIAGVFSTT